MEQRFEEVLGKWRDNPFIAKHTVNLSGWHITLTVYDGLTRLVASCEHGCWLWYKRWLEDGNITREESWSNGERDADPAKHRPSETIMTQLRKKIKCQNKNDQNRPHSQSGNP